MRESDGPAYSNAQKYWRTQYLAELGAESTTLFDELGMDGLEAQVNRVRKLEQDRYSNIEKSIKKLDTELNSAFGSKRLEILDEIMELEYFIDEYERLKNNIQKNSYVRNKKQY